MISRYESVLYATWSEENQNEDGEYGSWEAVEGTEFYYNGNTKTEPKPLRTVSNAHYISKSSQITGFSLVSLSCFQSLCCALWVFWNRKERLVRASQPPFLYLLCAGSIMVAISLVFISFDEDKGWSESQLSTGCSVFPWVFIFGYETICKIWLSLPLLGSKWHHVLLISHLLP